MKPGMTLLMCGAVLAAACAGGAARNAPDAVRAAENSIRGEDFIAHVTVLSSDKFEGRGPGTAGETLTVD